MFLGWSSFIYPLEADDLAPLPDYAGEPIPDDRLPPDGVVVLIRRGKEDVLVRGREIVEHARGGTVSVRIVFVPSIARWNLPTTLIRVLRTPHRFDGSRVYHMSARIIRLMGLERMIRTRENAFKVGGLNLSDERRNAVLDELYASLRRGFDDARPLVVMLCRTAGCRDTLDQGHHRMQGCLECGVDRVAVRFRAAGTVPVCLRGLFLAMGRRAFNRRVADNRRTLKTMNHVRPVSFSFCISDNYAQHLSVVIASLLVNNPDVPFVFHVLHRNVTPETEARVRELEKMYPNHRIVFHRIDASAFDRFPVPRTLAHITQETYYRYLLPDLLQDEERTIYSDVDVLCVGGDVRELWEMDLRGQPMAAVRKPKEERLRDAHLIPLGLSPDTRTFYAGMLVMDLVKLRAEGYTAACMVKTAENVGRLVFADMDVINLVMENRLTDIDPAWNMTERYTFFRSDVHIWHFVCQTQKPWCNLWKNTTWIPYARYLRRTPYRGNLLRLILGHLKGFFFFTYTKNRVKRYLVCGIRVWKRRV